jgi:hypothetical protein
MSNQLLNEGLETTSEIDTNAVQEVETGSDITESSGAEVDAASLSFDDLEALTEDDYQEALNDQKAESKQKNESQLETENSEEEGEISREEIQEEYKKLLAKYGEEELEIAANAVFTHKVDGEEVDVELQELLNNYSGKVSYDKKFQEFSTQRKEFEAYKTDYDRDIEAITTYVNNFRQKMSSDKPLEALDYFAEFSGMKPHEFRRQLLNAMIPEVNRVSTMSAEQYRNEYLKAENQYLLRKQESENAIRSQEQAGKELLGEIKHVQEAHNIPEEDFLNAFQELSESSYEGEMTPQAVAEYYMHSQAFSKADSILSQVNPNLVKDEKVVESFQNVIMENPDFDDNDLLEIVQEVYGNFKKETSQKVSNKIAKSSTKQVTKGRSNDVVVEDHIDWDDL